MELEGKTLKWETNGCSSGLASRLSLNRLDLARENGPSFPVERARCDVELYGEPLSRRHLGQLTRRNAPPRGQNGRGRLATFRRWNAIERISLQMPSAIRGVCIQMPLIVRYFILSALLDGVSASLQILALAHVHPEFLYNLTC